MTKKILIIVLTKLMIVLSFLFLFTGIEALAQYLSLNPGSVGSNQSICYNTSPATFTQTATPTGGTGSYTYCWQEQQECTGSWSDIAGAVSSTYQPNEAVIRVRETDTLIVMTSNIMPQFRSSITAFHGNRIKKMEIGGLPTENATELFKILDNDTQFDCGTAKVSNKTLVGIAERFDCRPMTIIEFMAFLKDNSRKITQIDKKTINVFAYKHAAKIYTELNSEQKKIMDYLAKSKHAVLEEDLQQMLPDMDITPVLISLVKRYLIKAVSVNNSSECTIHPLMQKYLLEEIS